VVVIAVVGAAVGLLCVALVILVAVNGGPSAAEVALAYEYAWDRLDFEAVWALSGAELRDGLDRAPFVAAKRAAYQHQPALRGIAEAVAVDAVSEGRGFAVVHTRVDLRDGGRAGDALQLAKRAGRWLVVSYELEPDRAGG